MEPKIVQVKASDNKTVTIHGGLGGTVSLEVQDIEPKSGGVAIVLTAHQIFTADTWLAILEAIKRYQDVTP
jgi:hypothetical protein